ncbi:MAG: class B sortase, partial [Clostridia bacterium]|nr:class B sortase [Clostridia bacterium]
MNKKYKIILMLLIVILTISSYFFIKEIAENKKENDIYDDLQELVQNQEIDDKTDNSSIQENTNENNYNLENIVKINSDVIGWIKIDGTNIDYPVMQNKNFYLHKNIYKNYSSHGTPYLAEHCNLKSSDNLIIYGHHMNDNSMF